MYNIIAYQLLTGLPIWYSVAVGLVWYLYFMLSSVYYCMWRINSFRDAVRSMDSGGSKKPCVRPWLLGVYIVFIRAVWFRLILTTELLLVAGHCRLFVCQSLTQSHPSIRTRGKFPKFVVRMVWYTDHSVWLAFFALLFLPPACILGPTR